MNTWKNFEHNKFGKLQQQIAFLNLPGFFAYRGQLAPFGEAEATIFSKKKFFSKLKMAAEGGHFEFKKKIFFLKKWAFGPFFNGCFPHMCGKQVVFHTCVENNNWNCDGK